MRHVQITWDLLRATAFLDFLEMVKLAVVMTFLGCDFKGYVMQFASFGKLKSVFASFGPGLFEEFRHRICFLTSIANDGKDKHGLKPKKIGPTFSSLHAQNFSVIVLPDEAGLIYFS